MSTERVTLHKAQGQPSLQAGPPKRAARYIPPHSININLRDSHVKAVPEPENLAEFQFLRGRRYKFRVAGLQGCQSHGTEYRCLVKNIPIK